MNSPFARLRSWLLRDTWALPLDCFRVATGMLAGWYFVRLLYEIPDFSSPDGLLDHAFLANILWFTRWSLFQPGVESWMFYVAYAVGLAGALAIIVGEQPRRWAFVLFVLVTSQYRWNFPVIGIDDAVMDLCLFWLVLLPVGHTLVLRQRLREGGAVWSRWAAITVPGATARCFLANVCLVYLTAGLSKLAFSEYWRNGFALYAILRQPIAWSPDFWTPAMLPVLRLASWASLATELALPILLTRRPGSPFKWIGLLLMVGFHLGIIVTLRVPLANVAMIATAFVFFSQEIGSSLARRVGAAPSTHVARGRRFRPAEVLGVVVVLLLAIAMLRKVPPLRQVSLPAYGLLWAIGLAQDYNLFSWVDNRSWHMTNRALVTRPGGSREEVPADSVLPVSMRHILLQAYLHRVSWMRFPRERRPEHRARIARRIAARACERGNWDGTVLLMGEVSKIRPGNAGLTQTISRKLVEFTCDGTALVSWSSGVAPDLVEPDDRDELWIPR